MVQCHGSTLLPQFLGMYRASVESEESYLLAMRNTFSHRLPVHRKYDLKVTGGPRPDAPPPGPMPPPIWPHTPSLYVFVPPPPMCTQGSLVSREASDKEKVMGRGEGGAWNE